MNTDGQPQNGSAAICEDFFPLAPAGQIKQEAYPDKTIAGESAKGKAFSEQLKEYIGSIVLGLADAIIEITGTHAGFLGVTGSTLIAGISGTIVGIAASISMASASYLQAKQHAERSPIGSAAATGVSYLCSVICLALPYFLIHAMLPAFIVSTSIGVLIIAGFTLYGAIVFGRKFWSEFAEAILLMLGTAGITFFIGTVIGKIFHLDSGGL